MKEQRVSFTNRCDIDWSCTVTNIAFMKFIDAPVETREVEIQAEPEVQHECHDIGSYDGNCFMSVSNMEDFGWLSDVDDAEDGSATTTSRMARRRRRRGWLGDDVEGGSAMSKSRTPRMA